MNKPAYAAASIRNSKPILDALRHELLGRRAVLEIGSGTACHAVRFARAMPQLEWQTSELADTLELIRRNLLAENVPNVLPPIELDMERPPAARREFDTVYSCNTLHIMSDNAGRQMLAFVSASLRPGGVFAYYGPFLRGGRYNTDSNAAFDRSLGARDPAMGLRDLDTVDRRAADSGLELVRLYAMPANNLLAVWRLYSGGPSVSLLSD